MVIAATASTRRSGTGHFVIFDLQGGQDDRRQDKIPAETQKHLRKDIR